MGLGQGTSPTAPSQVEGGLVACRWLSRQGTRIGVKVTEPTIFRKIIDGDIPADVVFQDELCLAFRDVNPQAPTHILVIPRKEIASIDAIADEDQSLIGHLYLVIRNLAQDLGLENGYRVVVNCGAEGGQTVDHLHLHLLAGRPFSWPPG